MIKAKELRKIVENPEEIEHIAQFRAEQISYKAICAALAGMRVVSVEFPVISPDEEDTALDLAINREVARIVHKAGIKGIVVYGHNDDGKRTVTFMLNW